MKVLSIFDGISCARVALERAGIPIEQYFASEIDKYAISISQKNYPDIIQLGSVTDINTKVLCLSGVYNILKLYDTNIQNHFSEQEMLYWLNQNFSISAKIRTQITNGNTSKSAIIQRIEEIRFSKCGMEDIIKTQYLIPSRTIRENGNFESQELLLQCGEWGYVCRIDTGNKAENIQRTNGKKTKARKHRENQTVSNQAVQQSPVTNTVVGADQKGNVETREPQEISHRFEESKEWRTKKIADRVEKARSVVQEIVRLIPDRNEPKRASQKEWNLLSIHKKMETTVVKTDTTVDIFTGTFEIMCGGSPCQDLSIAKKNRKGLDGERSGLFWEYVRILNEVKPKYFILENVNSMPKEAKELITKTLGVEPIMINASLVSAQNRKRLFWVGKRVGLTVLEGKPYYEKVEMPQPEDRGILLKDILENGEVVANPKMMNWKGDTKKSVTLTSSMYKEPPIVGTADSIYQYRRTYWRETKGGKVPTLTANMGTGGNNVPYVIAPNGKKIEIPDADKIAVFKEVRTEEGKKSRREARIKTGRDTTLRGKDHKKYSPDYSGKANCLVTGDGVEKMVNVPQGIRKLTTIECERLQGLPDNYSEGISNTQRYKCLGNAFNCDVVSHILSFITRV